MAARERERQTETAQTYSDRKEGGRDGGRVGGRKAMRERERARARERVCFTERERETLIW